MSTSIDRQIENWLSTSGHGERGRVQIGLKDEDRIATKRVALTRSARWDLAGLFAAGGASSVFILATLLPAPVPPRPDCPPGQLAVASPSPASLPAAPGELASAHVDAAHPSWPANAPRSAVNRTRHAGRSQRPTQSRWTRMLVGDGKASVLPFPVPR